MNDGKEGGHEFSMKEWKWKSEGDGGGGEWNKWGGRKGRKEKE
jgi:hypothetical protein